jgi:YD repeat-containing protein
MKIIAVFISVLILALGSCASTPSTSGGGGGVTETGNAAGSAVAGQTPQQRNSFRTKELVYFAAGSAGTYTAGALDEYTVFEWDSSFSHVLRETCYSASDSVLEKIEYAYQGNNPATKTTKIIVADEKGKEQEQVRTQVEYQYAQGRLQSEILKNTAGNVVSSYAYTYDGQGNRTGRIMKNGKDAVRAETVYTWTNGRIASAETKSAGGSKISSIVYQYDGQGNLIKQETRNAGGQITSVLTATWQNGLETKIELTGADNAPQQRETNAYNAGGDMVKKTIENIQGKSAQIIQYEYTGR